MRFHFGLAITALILLVEHWFPWFRKLPRLAAYSLGCAAIMLGIAIWLWPDWATIVRIVAFFVVGGAAVFGAYGYDALINWFLRRNTWGKGGHTEAG